MIILKKWKRTDPSVKSGWFEISLDEAIEELEGEGNGFWEKNTVQEMLENDMELWNLFARFKRKREII